MKNILFAAKIKQKTNTITPLADRLMSIKLKDYSLLACRDFRTEFETQEFMHEAGFSVVPFPRFYIVVSQNRDISLNEVLSSSQRVFINFESFKWSEIYFSLFKKFSSEAMNRHIYNNLLFNLDLKLAQFQTLSINIDRMKAHTNLVSTLLNSEEAETFFIIYLYELLLISIDRGSYSILKDLFSKLEASLLLNHFVEKKIVSLLDGKFEVRIPLLQSLLQYFGQHNGKFSITEKSHTRTDEFIFALQSEFIKMEPLLQTKVFDSSFRHT